MGRGERSPSRAWTICTEVSRASSSFEGSEMDSGSIEEALGSLVSTSKP